MTLVAHPQQVSVSATELPHRRHIRSAIDGVRSVAGVILIVIGIGLAEVFDSTLVGLAADTTTMVGNLPGWLHDLAGAVLASIVAGGALLAVVGSLFRTHYRRFTLLAVGMASAALASLLIGRLIRARADESVQNTLSVDVPLFRLEAADGHLNPADPLLAAAIAALVIGGTFLSQTFIRRGAVFVGGYAAGSLLTVGAPPLAFVADLGVGLAVGYALLLVFGRHDLTLRRPDVRWALESEGIQLSSLGPAPRGLGDGWLATQPDGRKLFVLAYSRDDRNADLIIGLVRWLRLRRTGNHRPFLSLRRSVEHEALVRHQAASHRVATPNVVAVAPAGVDGMVLALEPIDGLRATEIDDLADGSLGELWSQAVKLHDARIAHGSLNLGNVTIDRNGQPWLRGFDGSELSATEQRLGTDIAELLASTIVAVGTERALRVAVQTAGPHIIRQALPWLQPLALTKDTRVALAEVAGFAEVRERLAEACGVGLEEPVPLERIDRKSLFVLGTLVLSAWFLVPQFSDLDSIWSQIRTASLPWAVAAVGFSGCTYLAATSSLLAAVPTRLAYGRALVAQVASSFANRVTPVKVGGIATNIRYFQRQGVPTATSVTAVGLTAIAGVVVHVGLTLCFLLLASGDDRAGGLQLPTTRVVLLALGASAAAIALAVAVPTTRGLINEHVMPHLRTGWDGLRSIVRDPTRLTALLCGSALITLSYLAAMIASLKAFDSDSSFLMIALLFLAGSAVANAAPTPGGLGAAEAALIAALSTVEATEVVVPAVFLYRFVTFWLPILPGWLALTYLRQSDNL